MEMIDSLRNASSFVRITRFVPNIIFFLNYKRIKRKHYLQFTKLYSKNSVRFLKNSGSTLDRFIAATMFRGSAGGVLRAKPENAKPLTGAPHVARQQHPPGCMQVLESRRYTKHENAPTRNLHQQARALRGLGVDSISPTAVA
jgi:hypothetical protein